MRIWLPIGHIYAMTNTDNQWGPTNISDETPYVIESVTPEERTWAMLAHISAVVAMFVSAGWLSFVGPLLVWYLQKDKSSYVRQAAAQSFNFNLGMAIGSIIGWIMIFTIILAPIGLIVLIAVTVLTLWHHIRATIAASKNQRYHYPFQIQILS